MWYNETVCRCRQSTHKLIESNWCPQFLDIGRVSSWHFFFPVTLTSVVNEIIRIWVCQKVRHQKKSRRSSLLIMSPIHSPFLGGYIGIYPMYIPCMSHVCPMYVPCMSHVHPSFQSNLVPQLGPRTVQRLYFAVSSWSSSTASLQCPGVFAATTNVRKTIALMLRKEIYLRAVTCPDIGAMLPTRFL